jgi:hypothetical protein
MKAAATRASYRPFFVAYWLYQHAEAYGLTHAALLAELGIAPDDWPVLALCRRPTTEPHIAEIVARFPGLDPATLRRVCGLREVPGEC